MVNRVHASKYLKTETNLKHDFTSSLEISVTESNFLSNKDTSIVNRAQLRHFDIFWSWAKLPLHGREPEK